MHEGLAELHRRYPWPEKRPDVIDDPAGWFKGANRELLAKLLKERNAKLVVELGSLCGLSASHIVQYAPQATLICVDHWRGSPEHQNRPGWEQRLPELYERFLRNLWPWKSRVIPMRRTCREALPELHRLGLRPDLIYVDADHAADEVYHDVHTSLSLFPAAEIVGDDWMRDDVRRGVVRAARNCKFLGVHKWQIWHLPPQDRRP